MMLKIVNEPDSLHVPSMKPVKHKHRENLAESTSVVPTKDSLKVKLEKIIFYHSRVPKLRYYAYVDLWGL